LRAGQHPRLPAFPGVRRLRRAGACGLGDAARAVRVRRVPGRVRPPLRRRARAAARARVPARARGADRVPGAAHARQPRPGRGPRRGLGRTGGLGRARPLLRPLPDGRRTMRVAREGSATGLGSFLSAASFLVPPRLDDPAGLEHAPFGCWLLGALRPATVVDLAPGSFYLALCRAAETGGADARLYAVGPAAGALARWNRPYAAFSTLLPADPVEAASGFEDESVDVLRLRGARELYAAWLPKLSRRAVLLLEGTNARDGDARDLWRELAPVQPHFEFVHGGGLGVVAAGEAPEELRALLELDEGGGAGLVRLAYERLGSALRDRGTAERSDPDASARAARLEAELQWAYDNLVARAEDAGRLHDRLVEIESSTTWRLTQRPRAFLARHETLRRLLRLALGSAWRALRRAARRRRRGEAAFDPDVGYERWVALYDTLGKGERLAMAAHARALESQ